METFFVLAIIVIACFALFKVIKSSKRTIDKQMIGRTPVGQRRRRRNGGFYPVGYIGPYYGDEDLIDELLFVAEIAAADALIDDFVDDRGTLAIEDETADVLGAEEREAEPVVEPEPVAVNNDDDIKSGSGSIFDSGDSDDSWGSSDDSGGDDD